MFSELRFRRTRGVYALAMSVALHLGVLLVLLHRPHAIFVRPSFIAAGNNRVTSIVYVAATAGADAAPPEETRLRLPATEHRIPKQEVKTHQDQSNPNQTASVTEATQAGSRYGSSLNGSSDGHDVRPALPVHFPDPDVERSAIPSGVEGNVIVQITIDVQGNVVETKLLQGLGYGIEDKVISTVQNWRFKPATQDGVAIASQQDVSFHFPS